jgi:hypothetical protein
MQVQTGVGRVLRIKAELAVSLNALKGPVRPPLVSPRFRRDRAQPSEKPLFYLRMPAVLATS